MGCVEIWDTFEEISRCLKKVWKSGEGTKDKFVYFLCFKLLDD